MKKKLLLTLLLALLALFFVACGGSSNSEPAADTGAAEETTVEENADTTDETTEAETESDEGEMAADETAAEEEMEETEAEEMEESEEGSEEDSSSDTAAEEEETAAEEEEAAEEETAATGFGDLPLSGTDPETGLEINPETVNPGDTYLVRGTIISMNLTPVTSPEFLVETPDGQKFRFRSQPLEDTYFRDGSQWEPFEYQLGVGAEATVTLAPDASPSDIAASEDLTLIMLDSE